MARTHSMDEATDFLPKLLIISTQHLKVSLTNIHKESIQGWLQSCCENGTYIRTGRTNHAPGTLKTSLREILQLIPLQTRSTANENLSPCEPHGICLISGNQQTTSYWCPIQMSHQNSPLYLLTKYDHIDTFYTFQVHSNTLYCSRTNPGNITESKTDIHPHPKQPNNPIQKEEREAESKEVCLWALSWVTKSSIC